MGFRSEADWLARPVAHLTRGGLLRVEVAAAARQFLGAHGLDVIVVALP